MTILENLNRPEHIDRYIRELTMYLWRKCYQQDGAKFELMDDTYNVLSQLDNMLTGVVRKPAAPASEPVAAINEYGEPSYWHKHFTQEPWASRFRPCYLHPAAPQGEGA